MCLLLRANVTNDHGYFSNKLLEPRARVKLVAVKIQVTALILLVWLNSAPLVIISVCAVETLDKITHLYASY